MSVCNFSSFSCNIQKFCSLVSPFTINQQLRWSQTRSTSNFIVASSKEKPRKSRVRKPIKSNEDIVNELRGIISNAGLPENEVPSMKKLCELGRKDLANLVRRRGYKQISDILANSANHRDEERTSVHLDMINGCKKSIKEVHESKACGLNDDLPRTMKTSPRENNSSVDIVLAGLRNCDFDSSSFHEMASRFVKNGDLDVLGDALEVEDIPALNNSWLGSRTSSADGMDLAHYVEPCINTEIISSTENVNNIIQDSTANAASIVPPKCVTFEMNNHFARNDLSLPASGNNTNFPLDTMDNSSQNELKDLKTSLHERELELSQLKKQIEDEKLALSILQSKAEAEIGNAQRMILEKDAELNAFEESLSGLVEVRIDYLGDGDIVEVAGSFNGWQDRVQMDPHVPPENIGPTESRKPKLWTTVLWLYPGIYEIKFVVDGQWMIDVEREFVTRGHIQNNVLRVDR